ncbi:MAG: hypothetical protein ABI895_32195 [Deltaproteobacteria bacterium]
MLRSPMRERSRTDALLVVRGLFLLLGCTSADTPAGSGADAGAPAPISEAEWLAQTAPRAGVHEVWSEACNGVRIEQDYRVAPAIQCSQRRAGDSFVYDTFDCVVGDYCETSADCTDKPGGVCRGSAGSSCAYASVPEQPCEQDAECLQLPGGRCMPGQGGGQTFCYPTGECSRTSVPAPSCVYPSLYGSACRSDSECSAAPGGRCELWLGPTTCMYNECEASCGPSARCECQDLRRCLPAECLRDADCGAGFRCEGTLDLPCGNLYPPVGYYCHAEQDECQSDADCGGQSCVFDPALSFWACRRLSCVTR